MSRSAFLFFSYIDLSLLTTEPLRSAAIEGPVLLTDEATLLAGQMIDASTAQETAGKNTTFDISRDLSSTSQVFAVLVSLGYSLNTNTADMP